MVNTAGTLTVVVDGDEVDIGSGGAVTTNVDDNAIHDNVASEITAITEKTSLVDDDVFIIEDSADSNAKKRVKKSNVGGGNHALLDGASVTDSNAFTVTRGAIPYGKAASPKWDGLLVGSVNQILTSDGTDVSWGAIPGAYLGTQKPDWVFADDTTDDLTHGIASPTSGVQYVPGHFHLKGSIVSDVVGYVAFQLPDTFPAGTMELTIKSLTKTNPSSSLTNVITLEWDDYADGADLDAITLNGEGTETFTYSNTSQFNWLSVSHVFGTVPTAGRLLVCKLTFENASTMTEDCIFRVGLRWV